ALPEAAGVAGDAFGIEHEYLMAFVEEKLRERLAIRAGALECRPHVAGEVLAQPGAQLAEPARVVVELPLHDALGVEAKRGVELALRDINTEGWSVHGMFFCTRWEPAAVGRNLVVGVILIR